MKKVMFTIKSFERFAKPKNFGLKFIIYLLIPLLLFVSKSF